ncbi:MAG: CIA30 family protein [Gammaproteobacteria bacterium]|nr:CIA30 family protein [Gammaproteobacteria bacterium]
MSQPVNKLAFYNLTAATILFAVSAWAAPPVQTHAPVASVAPAGVLLIGGFEGKTVQNKKYGTLVINHGHEFGWGWSVTTDQRAGGHSVADIALIHPGVDGTHGALQVSGEIKSGFPYGPWAGAIWFPGHEPMQPADLSAKKELTFWARGKPGSYNLMLMSGSPGSIPLYSSFVTTPKWKEYHIPLAASFPNADWKRVYFLAFSAANPGKFEFDLDQVKLH